MFNRYFLYAFILLSFVLLTLGKSQEICKWYGTAPFCFSNNKCPSSCHKMRSGDGEKCWFGKKKYCCCAGAVVKTIFEILAGKK